MIVQSVPGPGGLKGTNYAAQVMPKNGKHIFEPPDPIIISELLNPKAARYKSNEFTWLGNRSTPKPVRRFRPSSRIY